LARMSVGRPLLSHSNRISKWVKCGHSSITVRCVNTESTSSTGSGDFYPKVDKASLFFNPNVQTRLQRLTGLDYSKVFRVSKLGKKIEAPTYAFLTQKELEKEQAKAKTQAARKLQMPPVMDARSNETEVIEEDPAIQGFDGARLVFTDITFGVHDRDRLIVVRDPDGTLRHADPDQRDRLNQIYFPKEGRKVDQPGIFKEENLEVLLKQKKYLHILDRNVAQFEPDHPVFIRVAEAVYDRVDANGDWDRLWSTRHYGPMVFHLIWQRKVDDLLAHFLQSINRKDRMEAVSDVLLLFTRFHTKSKLSDHVSEAVQESQERMGQDETVQLLRQFIALESRKSHKLKGALEAMLEADEANQKLAKESSGSRKNIKVKKSR